MISRLLINIDNIKFTKHFNKSPNNKWFAKKLLARENQCS